MGMHSPERSRGAAMDKCNTNFRPARGAGPQYVRIWIGEAEMASIIFRVLRIMVWVACWVVLRTG